MLHPPRTDTGLEEFRSIFGVPGEMREACITDYQISNRLMKEGKNLLSENANLEGLFTEMDIAGIRPHCIIQHWYIDGAHHFRYYIPPEGYQVVDYIKVTNERVQSHALAEAAKNVLMCLTGLFGTAAPLTRKLIEAVRPYYRNLDEDLKQ